MTEEEREALIAQGWTPPPVDPDEAEADRLYEAMDWPIGVKGDTPECYTAFIREGIKRGRELGRLDIQRAEGRAFMQKFFPLIYKGPNP